MKNFIVLLIVVLPYAVSKPYEPSGFRPSQPFPLPERVKPQIPAKQYGPPKPEYGPPKKPDDTVEPTTPPSNVRDTPSKFNNQLFQNQKLPSGNQQVNFVFPSNSNSFQPNKQNIHLNGQRLPEFGQKLFKPASLPSTSNISPRQALPNPIPFYVFNEVEANARPINFQQAKRPLNLNFEIQKSQQIPVQKHNDPNNFNFNNQNNLNVQAPSLPGLLGISPKQSEKENKRQRMDVRNNRIANVKTQSQLLGGNEFSNDEFLSAKRASSPRRGGKVTAAPARQYFSEVTSTEASVVRPTFSRRRQTTTEPLNTDEDSISRKPNISIANAFAGRLFLLQSDGRLEPVILRRANPNPSNQDIISTAELIQPFIKPTQLSK